MSTEEQRIACAELCGWTDFVFEAHPAITYLWGVINGEKNLVPDYPNDERTRKDMLAVLTPEQQVMIACIIRNATVSYRTESDLNTWAVCGLVVFTLNLSQPDFCRAFLKASGKWKE